MSLRYKEDWRDILAKPHLNPCILALDIGGTKISYATFAVDQNGELQSLPIFAKEIPTQKGVSHLLKSISEIVSDALDASLKAGYKILPILTAGSPGRFVGMNQAFLAKGSAANMELVPGEWDGLNLSEKIRSVLPEFCEVIVKNDAIAQFSAGLGQLLPLDPARFLQQKMAYIGPGTGLGGGFCKIDAQGIPVYFTDGHIYDILIENEKGIRIKAEDLFSGRAFKTKTGYCAKDVNTDPCLLERFKPEIELLGLYMARLIEAIYQGHIEKVVSDDNWPKEDIEFVKGISIYLIGGSLGTKGEMGHLIRKTALDTLQTMGLGFVKIIPIAESHYAGVLGAAHFILFEKLNALLKTPVSID